MAQSKGLLFLLPLFCLGCASPQAHSDYLPAAEILAITRAVIEQTDMDVHKREATSIVVSWKGEPDTMLIYPRRLERNLFKLRVIGQGLNADHYLHGVAIEHLEYLRIEKSAHFFKSQDLGYLRLQNHFHREYRISDADQGNLNLCEIPELSQIDSVASQDRYILSIPLVSKDGLRAYVECELAGFGDGHGDYILLEKLGGAWQVVHQENMWME